MKIDIPCRFCPHTVNVDKDFAIKNGRVFCESCCKAFDVVVRSQEREIQSEDIPIYPYIGMDFSQDESEEELDTEDMDDFDIPF